MTWTDRRKRALPRWELGLATIATLACIAALTSSMTGLVKWSVPTTAPQPTPERVAFVSVRPSGTTTSVARSPVTPRAPALPQTAVRVDTSIDASTPTSTAASQPAVAISVAPRPSAPAEQLAGPRLAPVAFGLRSKYWSAQRESVLAEHGSRAPILPWIVPPPTPEERDAAARAGPPAAARTHRPASGAGVDARRHVWRNLPSAFQPRPVTRTAPSRQHHFRRESAAVAARAAASSTTQRLHSLCGLAATPPHARTAGLVELNANRDPLERWRLQRKRERPGHRRRGRGNTVIALFYGSIAHGSPKVTWALTRLLQPQPLNPIEATPSDPQPMHAVRAYTKPTLPRRAWRSTSRRMSCRPSPRR